MQYFANMISMLVLTAFLTNPLTLSQKPDENVSETPEAQLQRIMFAKYCM